MPSISRASFFYEAYSSLLANAEQIDRTNRQNWSREGPEGEGRDMSAPFELPSCMCNQSRLQSRTETKHAQLGQRAKAEDIGSASKRSHHLKHCCCLSLFSFPCQRMSGNPRRQQRGRPATKNHFFAWYQGQMLTRRLK